MADWHGRLFNLLTHFNVVNTETLGGSADEKGTGLGLKAGG